MQTTLWHMTYSSILKHLPCGWEKQGNALKVLLVTWLLALEALKSPDSLDLTPAVRFWTCFFQPGSFWKPEELLLLHLQLHGDPRTGLCKAGSNPTLWELTQTPGPPQCPQTSPSPPAQHSNNAPGKQPEITAHTGLHFGALLKQLLLELFFRSCGFLLVMRSPAQQRENRFGCACVRSWTLVREGVKSTDSSARGPCGLQ